MFYLFYLSMKMKPLTKGGWGVVLTAAQPRFVRFEPNLRELWFCGSCSHILASGELSWWKREHSSQNIRGWNLRRLEMELWGWSLRRLEMELWGWSLRRSVGNPLITPEQHRSLCSYVSQDGVQGMRILHSLTPEPGKRGKSVKSLSRNGLELVPWICRFISRSPRLP